MTALLAIFTAYILTVIITSGSIMEPVRAWVKTRIPATHQARHFIECRLCVGLWISLVVAVFYGTPENILLIYGGSYFLATQERR